MVRKTETMNKATIGFTNPREAGDEMADIKRLFTPEFRNRLDAIVGFKALDEQVILRVVDKFLLQLETQLAEKKSRSPSPTSCASTWPRRASIR